MRVDVGVAHWGLTAGQAERLAARLAGFVVRWGWGSANNRRLVSECERRFKAESGPSCLVSRFMLLEVSQQRSSHSNILPAVWRRFSGQVALHTSRLQCLEQSRQAATNMTSIREPTTVGIDFGTSNCAAYLPNGRSDAIPAPLEGKELLMPSVMFITRSEIAAREIQQTEFTNRFRMAKRAEAELDPEKRSSDDELRLQVEQAMKRELAQEAERQYWDQTFFSMLESGRQLFLEPQPLKPTSGSR